MSDAIDIGYWLNLSDDQFINAVREHSRSNELTQTATSFLLGMALARLSMKTAGTRLDEATAAMIHMPKKDH